MVIATASPEGVGIHSCEGFGMRGYKEWLRWLQEAEVFRDRGLILHTPNLTQLEVKHLHPPHCIVCNRWGQVIGDLERVISLPAKGGTIPCGHLPTILPVPGIRALEKSAQITKGRSLSSIVIPGRRENFYQCHFAQGLDLMLHAARDEVAITRRDAMGLLADGHHHLPLEDDADLFMEVAVESG